MKEILATWIIFQLLIIGWVGIEFRNQAFTGEYDCTPPDRKASHITGLILPLMFFLPSDDYDYCDDK